MRASFRFTPEGRLSFGLPADQMTWETSAKSAAPLRLLGKLFSLALLLRHRAPSAVQLQQHPRSLLADPPDRGAVVMDLKGRFVSIDLIYHYLVWVFARDQQFELQGARFVSQTSVSVGH